MNPGLLLFFIEVKGSLTVLSLPLPAPFIPGGGGGGSARPFSCRVWAAERTEEMLPCGSVTASAKHNRARSCCLQGEQP